MDDVGVIADVRGVRHSLENLMQIARPADLFEQFEPGELFGQRDGIDRPAAPLAHAANRRRKSADARRDRNGWP